MRAAFRTTADRASFALFAMAVLIAAAALLYMLAARQSLGVAGLFDAAAERSAFSPTVFEFYDRSTKENCDRLIVVQPFEWYVWCCRGRLLILNPEGGIRCSAGKTPAVRVTASSEFVETCVDVNLATLIDLYRANGVYFRVPYELPSGTKTFTILSALNALAPEWIEIRDESTGGGDESTGGGGNGDTVDAPTKAPDGRTLVEVVEPEHGDAVAAASRRKRDIRIGDWPGSTPLPPAGQTGRKHGTYGRWLTANEMERVVRPPLGRATNRDHNALLEAYRLHMYGPGNS